MSEKYRTVKGSGFDKRDAFVDKRFADAENYNVIRRKLLMDDKPDKIYKVVSFPGPKAIWEPGLELAIPERSFEFYGVESDPFYWASMVQDFSNRPANYKACLEEEKDLRDFIARHPNMQADIAYTDFTDGTSDDDWSLFHRMLSNNFLAPDAIVMLTMYLQRGSTLNLEKAVARMKKASFDKRDLDRICDISFVDGNPATLTEAGKPYDDITKMVYDRFRSMGMVVSVRKAVVYRTYKNPESPCPMIQVCCERLNLRKYIRRQEKRLVHV